MVRSMECLRAYTGRLTGVLGATATLIVIAAGCGGDEDGTAQNGTPRGDGVHATVTLPPDASWRGEFVGVAPTTRPAPSDEHGKWSQIEESGAKIEIPFGDEWRIQFIADPCHGDARHYIVLEHRVTKDRIRADIATGEARGESQDPQRIAGVIERIRRSAEGSYVVPLMLKTLGPIPTQASCATDDPLQVPTLVADTFTPQSIR